MRRQRSRSRSPPRERAVRSRLSRSRSPPRERAARSRSPSPTRGTRVLVFDGDITPSDRSKLISEGLKVYDHLLPFRKAAQFILNAEHHSKSRSSPQEMESFSDFLSKATTHNQGSMFPYIHFMEWLRGQRKASDVVVVSIRDKESLASLERRSALVFGGDVSDIPRMIRRCKSFVF